MVCTIQEKMKEVFKLYAEEVAIEYGQDKITYKALNEFSTSFSHKLVTYDYKEKKIIAVLLNNKLDFIIAVISILKSGNIFMPLDASLMEQRLAIMFEVAKPDYIITDKINKGRIEEYFEDDQIYMFHREVENCEKGSMQGKLFNLFMADDPIYIFFTSGTTGRPKAIVGKNKSLLHFVNWEADFLQLQKNTRISQFTSHGFDAILRDIFTTLVVGGTICIPERKEIILDIDELGNWIEKYEIQVIHCTPTLFRSINRNLEEGRYPKLKYVLMAGEKIVPRELQRWYDLVGERVQLINLYGPTEATMVKTYYVIKPSDAFCSSIPIGKPMAGVDIYIMDPDMRCCECDVEGEICIATDYMTLGYYNNEELNNEKFPLVTLDNGVKKQIYRTNDYGKINSQGLLEFLGRKDRQVKIRGNRIELTEIENALLQYDGITESYVHYFDEEKECEGECYCVRCGITDKYKGVFLDKKGICNVCNEYEKYQSLMNSYFETLDVLKEKLESNRDDQAKYDCILLYSGGKDSTYVLYKLIEMGIRVLAFVFDNGYISDMAYENIKRTVHECNVDYMIAKYEDMDEVFREGIRKNGSVCEGCFKILRTLSTMTAYEKNIKYVVSGLSRGQICDTKLYDILKQDVLTVEEIKQKMFEQRCLYYANREYTLGKLCNQYTIGEEVLKQVEWVDFYQYCNVTKDEILAYLQKKAYSWNLPTNTGACSTNCMINDVGIYIQRKRVGYDNYTFSDSWDVRLGHITLQQSFEKTANEIDVNRVHDIMDRFGMEEDIVSVENSIPKKSLVAYYIAEKTIDEQLLFKYLRSMLTDAHLPTEFCRLDQIPMNTNGKVDVSLLPKTASVTSRKYEAFEDVIELQVAQIWSEILGREAFNRNDNFLSVGGQSLQIMTMISKISDTFNVVIPLEELFNNASISAISTYIKNNLYLEVDCITKAEEKEYYPLTKQQFEIYMAEVAEECKTSYLISSVIHVNGQMEPKQLEKALNRLISRHEILRTSFDIVNGQIVQQIHQNISIKLDIIQTSAEDVQKDRKKCIRAFDLKKAPLVRAMILIYPDNKAELMLVTHHIITDGLSVRILVDELNALYNEQPLDKVKLQYKDYSQWKNDLKRDLFECENYWNNLFATYHVNSGFPVEHEIKASGVYQGKDYDLELDDGLINQLNRLAVENSVTLFSVLFSAFHILYGKYAALEDVTIGTPIDMRNSSCLINMIGDYANAVPIRSFPKSSIEYHDYLRGFQKQLIYAMKYSEYSVVDISKKLQCLKDFGQLNLIDTVFTMFYQEDKFDEKNNVSFQLYNDETDTERYKLRIVIVNSNGSCKLKIKYAVEMFESHTIKRIADDYVKILETVASNNKVRLGEIAFTAKLTLDHEVFQVGEYDF